MATTRINNIPINIGRLSDDELSGVIEQAKIRLLAAQKDVSVLCNEQDYRVRFGTHPSRIEFADAVGAVD